MPWPRVRRRSRSRPATCALYHWSNYARAMHRCVRERCTGVRSFVASFRCAWRRVLMTATPSKFWMASRDWLDGESKVAPWCRLSSSRSARPVSTRSSCSGPMRPRARSQPWMRHASSARSWSRTDAHQHKLHGYWDTSPIGSSGARQLEHVCQRVLRISLPRGHWGPRWRTR